MGSLRSIIEGATNGKVAPFKNKETGRIISYAYVQTVITENDKVLYHVQNVDDGSTNLIDDSFGDLFLGYAENYAEKYRIYVEAQLAVNQRIFQEEAEREYERRLKKEQLMQLTKPALTKSTRPHLIS